MPSRSTIFRFLASFVILAMGQASPAWAAFPERPVRLVVPYTAGGASDGVTRLVAAKLADMWKQSVVVDNRGGANGIIGCEFVARAAPDGYTLLMATVGTHGINPGLYKKLPYDAVKDFEPISMIGATMSVLTVNPELPIHSVKELIAYAKQHPDKLNFGSSGNGSSHHLAGAMFNSLAGVKTGHVPYKGSSAMLTDVVSGQIQMTFDPVISSLPFIQSGRLRPLAVTGTSRTSALPDLPTMEEAGVPGYSSSSWYGLLAPKGTPPEVTAKILKDVQTVLAMPDVKEKLALLGVDAMSSTSEQLAKHIQTEMAKWAEVIGYSGASVN